MLGLDFGYWTVTEVGLWRGKLKACRCRCVCGKETIQVCANLRHRVKAGIVQSCGCKKGETIRAAKSTHGESGSRVTAEHRAWSNMKSRCSNPRLPCWPDYGGRGIRVCDRWLHSFENFLVDMGRRPSPGHSLDRIDTNGPYSAENCRWVTRKVQNRNKRSNVVVIHEGESAPVVTWCERLGLSHAAVRNRIHRGKTPRQALGFDP